MFTALSMGLSHELPNEGYQAIALISYDQNVNQFDDPRVQQWTTAIDPNVNLVTEQQIQQEPLQQQQTILFVSTPMDLIESVKPVQVMLSPCSIQTAVQCPVNVIQVPTNLLLTDNNSYIVIPPEGLTLEVPAMNLAVDNSLTLPSTITLASPSINITQDNQLSPTASNEMAKEWYVDAELVARGLDAYNSTTKNSQQQHQIQTHELQTHQLQTQQLQTQQLQTQQLQTQQLQTQQLYQQQFEVVTFEDERTRDSFNISMENCLVQTLNQQHQQELFNFNVNSNEDSNEDSNSNSNSNSNVDYADVLRLSEVEVGQDVVTDEQARQWSNDSVISYRAMLMFKKTNVGKNFNTKNMKRY